MTAFPTVRVGAIQATPEAAGARVGGLICWKNRMPLARYRVYRRGVSHIWR